jgi:hypothetical protein
MIELKAMLQSLLAVFGLGFMEMPTIILLSSMLILFGFGFKKPLLSYGGLTFIFTYYLFIEFAALI